MTQSSGAGSRGWRKITLSDINRAEQERRTRKGRPETGRKAEQSSIDEVVAQVLETRHAPTKNGVGRKLEVVLDVSGRRVIDSMLVDHPDPEVLAIQHVKRNGFREAQKANPEFVMVRVKTKGRQVQVQGYAPVEKGDLGG